MGLLLLVKGSLSPFAISVLLLFILTLLTGYGICLLQAQINQIEQIKTGRKSEFSKFFLTLQLGLI